MRSNTRERITTEELCRRYHQGHRDFSHIILKNKDLKDKDLTGANFSGAILTGTNFKGAKLQHTNFSDAKLKGVDFSHADLTGVNFSQVKASFLDWRKIIALILIILFSIYFLSFPWWLYPLIWLLCPFIWWLYLLIPVPLRTLRIRTKFAHSNLNGADFRSAKLEGIDFSRSLNLKNINFHNASLHRANFAGRHLKENNFSNAKLYGTNFSKTKLKQSNFTHSKSGVPFTFGIHLLSIIFCSFFGFLIAFIPAFSFYFLLESQIINSTSETQEFSIFVYILIIIVGFLHFLCSSLFKDMDEAVIGLGFTALTILLVMTNQPLIIISALVMVLIAIIRIVQIFWKINRFFVVLPPVFLLALCVLILYTYTYIAKSEVIEPIATCLVLLPFLSIRTAVTIAELEIILGWGKWKSVVIFGSVLSIILLLLLRISGKEWEAFIQILCFITGVGSILLGSYLAFKAIEDNPNYRGIRDRSVLLFHLFGGFGTRFRHSDLTCADFSFASLKNADFTNADLTRALWNGTRQLEYAKFGVNNYLRYPQIRQLFSNNCPRQSRSIRELIKIYRHWPPSLKKLIHFCLRERTDKLTKDFKGCDLRGIRLSYYGNSGNHNSFNLTKANFEDADLRGADLQGADLRGVNLVNTQLDEADLSYSDLTDGCIQNWQITRKTGLKQVRCQRLQLEKRIAQDIDPASQTFNEETILDIHQLQTLLISDEEQEKLDQLKNEFAKLNLIHNKVNRRYHLIQKANNAEESDGIPSELYIQMFELYRKQRIQAQRKQSWWQWILWFKIEPRIEKINEWTQELDIFPLLENLGRLSILFVVITFVNNVLKPDVEKRYRPWEMIHSDTEEFRGVSRFALEQLVQEGANLTYLKVKAEGADLKGINLRGANLSNADFSKAQLNNADLRGANLSNATLTGANLSNAKFGNPSQNDNEGQNSPISRILPPVPQVIKNMQRTNLEGANLKGANLTEANLTEANLTGAHLIEANLTRAHLIEANLTGANLIEANLTEANLTRANLEGTDLEGANLTWANLTGATLTWLNLEGINLEGANLEGANLEGANLEGANLKWANLTGANLEGTDLDGADLEGATFTNKQIKSACDWRLAVYTKAKWDDEKKIWIPEDEEANKKKIDEIANDPAPSSC